MPTDMIQKTQTCHSEDPNKNLQTCQPTQDPLAYQNLTIVKRFDKGKFPVYLVSSKINNQNYVLKVFSDTVQDADNCYQNELRFASLNHQNIVNVLSSGSYETPDQEGHTTKVSYMVEEYAPYGDFFDFIVNNKTQIDEKLARTYFRQLIEGIEYLHMLGIAHLDLKPGNLLIDADFNLKIADFDLCHVASDDEILGRGSKPFRGPELYNNLAIEHIQLEIPSAADIYSAGVILFILKCGGMFPHSENKIIEGVNFTELMEKNNSKFWTKHCEVQKKPKSFFDSNFKDLFSHMVKAKPEKRMTIKKIKESKWYRGPVYTPEELSQRMKAILNC